MRGSARLLPLLVSATVLAACSGPPAAPAGTATPPAAPASVATPTGPAIGGDRPVRMAVPPGYHPGRPAPLLIMLHGFGGSPDQDENYLALGPVAEAEGMLYARPEGRRDRRGQHFWNAFAACCDRDGTGVDDSAYLRGIVEEVRRHYTVDPGRIFVVGFSNGGFMAHRMACDHADLVAAVVSIAGAGPLTAADCRPARPVAVLQVHGDADTSVRYEGGEMGGGYPGAVRTVEDWARRNGCAVPGQPGPARDLVVTDESTPRRPDVAETRTLAYAAGCRPGGHVELWTVAGGSHLPVLSAGFARQVVDFLRAHPRPPG
ncbi:alpha/beta fold hydrolase [Micromonospora sp. NPDC047707]|uniref:alpha/beta fold hydrolase n=1 Tax=Micromonospora sp. NPDC047707 TaxID=3154498 RepID=UPI00345309C2